MNLEKNLKISMLNEFYGGLLTNRQKSILTDYYEFNMSLGEIAENLSITRQGVRDALIKAENALNSYEEKLGLLNRYNKLKIDLDKIINSNLNSEEIKLKLESLLELWEG